MRISISKSDIRKVNKELNKKGSEVGKGMKELVADIAGDIENTAKSLVKKQTMSLHDTIKAVIESGGLSAYVEAWGDEKYYAVFVEYGTLKHGPPQPFMNPALRQHAPRFIAKTRDVLKAKL